MGAEAKKRGKKGNARQGSGWKILFLDFDDVLNTASTLARGELFEGANVDALNAVTDRTGVAIVVTAMWRLGATSEELEGLLVDAGARAAGRVVGSTPCLVDRLRGDVRPAPAPVENFVILDDRSDMGFLHERLVRTNPQFELVPAQVEEIVNRLQ